MFSGFHGNRWLFCPILDFCTLWGMFSNILEVCIAPIFRVTECGSVECWSGWEEKECFGYVGSWRKSSQSELWEDEKDRVDMSQWEWVPRMALLRVNIGDCTGGQMWVVNDPFSGTMFERCTGGACVCVCVCVTGVRVRLFCPWKPPAALFSFRDEGFQRSL
jgi:hypothetical protein